MLAGFEGRDWLAGFDPRDWLVFGGRVPANVGGEGGGGPGSGGTVSLCSDCFEPHFATLASH